MRSSRLFYGCIASLAALLGPEAVFAAEAPDQVLVIAPRTTPLDQTVDLDKTGTPLEDLPRSVQIVPRALLDEQGATQLTDSLRDVSGVSQGGQFAFGFFDRVIIRGLNASYLNDGLPDGTSDLTGYVHSLTGVERVEVLKGPGSALYGSTEEGGTINLVHARPSDVDSGSISEQMGSYGTSTTEFSATGPTGLKAVDWRVDGTYQRSDGYRGQSSRTEELLPAFSWRPDNHDIEARLEYHHLENRPDSTGIPFSPPTGTGQPLAVSPDDRYYTPYAEAKQDIARLFLSDAWTVNDLLTINLRGAYSQRDVDLTRNAGGSVKLLTGTYQLTGRQLREQKDAFGDGNLQVEPTWHFTTGPLTHLLVTGAEMRDISGSTERATADLPNIANIFAPQITDGALSSLAFKCDASHSCDSANLSARFYGLYAIDQIDVTDSLKLRLSARQNWFSTEGEARGLLPVNGGQEQPCSPPTAAACPWVPGSPVKRHDEPATWDVGAVYFLTRDLSVFAGYNTAAYPIFNTEEPESIGQQPETGKQYEAGVRFKASTILTMSASAYHATRDNVFTLLSEPNPAGAGNIDVAQVFSYRVQGVETDINLRPTERWNVIANLAAQDAEITSYPQTPADIGKHPPSIPHMLANLWTSYDLTLPGILPLAQISLGARYRGNEFADAGQTRDVPGAVLYDSAVSLPYHDVTFTLGAENLLDRRNFLYGDGTGGGALPGAGRTLFARISAKIW